MTGKRLRSEAGCEGPVHAADLFGTFFPGFFFELSRFLL